MEEKMIKGTLSMANDVIEVIVDKNNIMFLDIGTGQITTIEGIRIDYNGVLKEFPDLKDDEEWKKKAIERLKEHMKKIDKEFDKLDYVKNELVKFGYNPLYYQQAGFRPKQW